MNKNNFSEKLRIIANQNIDEKNYWLEKLSGNIRKTIVPYDYQNNNEPEFHTYENEIPNEISQRLFQICKGSKDGLHMILMAAFFVFLNRRYKEKSVLIGTPIYKVDDNSELINKILPIQGVIDESKSFKEILSSVKGIISEADKFQNYPMDILASQLDIVSSNEFYSLFEIVLMLEEIHDLKYLEDIKLNLIFNFDFSKDYKRIKIIYNSSVYNSETINQIEIIFYKVIKELIFNPDVAIFDIDVLSKDEKQKLLNDFNDTQRDYPKDKCIHQLFEEQVEKTPLHIALKYEQEELTYHELNERSNQLARYLQNKGVNSNSKIALIMDRSFEMLISIFGILKSGGCYVPIDSSYPNARINYIIDNSETQLVLTEKAHIDKLDKGQAIEVFEDLDLKEFEVSNLERTSKPTDLSYIIYTSGSTGNPKGVMVGHSSVVNLLHFMQDKFPLTHHDSYLLKTSFCFDVSVIELFGWILGGSKLSILTKDHERDPGKILDAISNFQVTHINFVPSVFKSFSQSIILEEKSKLETLQYIMLAGESLIREHLREFKELGLNIQIENLYGPTEATVYASNSPINLELSEPITIGKPLSNAQMYILGLKNELQGIGIPGELCISGAGLALGYLNNPDLTQEKFIDHPFKDGEKLYRTGDLARWRSDGNIEFLGRIDHQVKIRGFRIELGEIENALLQHESIKEGVVLAREEQDDKYLCAYIVSEGDFNQEAVRTFLSTSLPDYMIPSYFVELDSLPLTSNGKVNRKVLPSPEVKAEVDYVAPSNETEERLVTMWSEVLNRPEEEISVIANFFALGGHSLKATIFINKLFEATGYELKLGDFFNISTIKEISDIFLLVNENSEEDNYQEISI